jgi:hypothetical protein
MTIFGDTPPRPEAEIFADLRTLCMSPGYIHAVAYFAWRDNVIRYSGAQVVAKDLEGKYGHDRLVRTEIATLIGLTIQEPFELSLPASDVMQGYIDRTEALLQELHRAMEKPWFEGWDLQGGKIIPERDLFANAAAMREPIFYGGDSAYSFQYRDLAHLKYSADDEWLEKNKGFRIGEASQIAESLGKLQMERQLECAETLRNSHQINGQCFPASSFRRGTW